jgi:trans-aconitate 2-methyltransferase
MSWDPAQYARFAQQRAQPFHDLLALVEPASIRRAVDLGCGPGELTALAAHQLHVAEMTGIDNSVAMIESAAAHTSATVRFSLGDIAGWTSSGDHDLVVAAASLQWVPDHPYVIAQWTAALAPGGQLAVQVPDNADAPTHRIAAALATTEPYVSAFGTDGPPADPVAANVLRPEQYAQLLFDLGFERQHVQLTVYPHILPTSRDSVEWVKGTTLTRFRAALPTELYQRFLADYEDRLLEVIGAHEPHFFPFRRILMWARLPLGGSE